MSEFNPESLNDPINRIEWRDADSLDPNTYNPNVVLNDELRLLERSILQSGWIQPLLITEAGIIVDGFHRWGLAMHSPALKAKYSGLVPVAVLDVTEDVAMAITVRINRAKGSHVAVSMHHLVARLVNEFAWDPQEVAAEIGAHITEVELLLKEDVFAVRDIKNHEYSKAWVPEER